MRQPQLLLLQQLQRCSELPRALEKRQRSGRGRRLKRRRLS
jgi:hypothetical protein